MARQQPHNIPMKVSRREAQVDSQSCSTRL